MLLKKYMNMKVMIIMGSTSDASVMEESQKWLSWFGIASETVVASAHRNADQVSELMNSAAEKGFGAVIAAAGMAAALPGVCAALTNLPVIGVPLEGGLPGGVDALYSIVQMPAGVPVGTMAVGKAGARNAAVLCARMFALSNPDLQEKLIEFAQQGYRI